MYYRSPGSMEIVNVVTFRRSLMGFMFLRLLFFFSFSKGVAPDMSQVLGSLLTLN